jgi:hypothetical protein
MTRKTAREFYFDFYGDGTASTMQQTYPFEVTDPYFHKQMPDYEDIKRQLLSFEPRLSNDFKLEFILDELVSSVSPRIKTKIEECFVVTRYDRDFQAFIRNHRQDMSGEVIFFSTGMSNALFAYAILLAWYMYRDSAFDQSEGSARMVELSASAPELTEEVVDSKLNAYAIELSRCQATWNENGTVEMDEALIDHQNSMYWEVPYFLQAFATTFANYAHKFVVGHEYAHYLLGHLDESDHYEEYSEVYIETWLQSRTLDIFHEYQADLLSLALNSGELNTDSVLSRDFRVSVEAAHGIAFTLTVFGQMMDPNYTTTTHPSIMERLNQCEALFRNFMTPEEHAGLMHFYQSFQRFLFRSQQRGVGAIFQQSS